MEIYCNTTIKVYCWHCIKKVMTVLITCDICVIKQAMFIDSILIKQS